MNDVLSLVGSIILSMILCMTLGCGEASEADNPDSGDTDNSEGAPSTSNETENESDAPEQNREDTTAQDEDEPQNETDTGASDENEPQNETDTGASDEDEPQNETDTGASDEDDPQDETDTGASDETEDTDTGAPDSTEPPDIEDTEIGPVLDTEFLPEGAPIADLGASDLDYDITAAVSPMAELPSLQGVDPEVIPALEDQVLPDESAVIHEIDKVSGVTGMEQAWLEEQIRSKGVVRYPAQNELMSEVLRTLSYSYRQPGVLLTSDALFNTFHNFFDNILLGLELRVLRPGLLALLNGVKAEAAKRYNALPAGDTKQAALDIVAYLQVAQTLMDPEAPVWMTTLHASIFWTWRRKLKNVMKRSMIP